MGRRAIAITAAVLLAIVGVATVILYANGADQRAVAGASPRTVFVSTKTVLTGTSLNDAVAQGLIVQTTIPAKAVPAQALTTVDDSNKNLLAQSDIAAGEYILSTRFGTTQTSVQAIRIPVGKVAVSVAMSDPARVGTFLQPGSTIVLYHSTGGTAAGTSGQSGQAAQPAAAVQTHILFDNVQVIGVGQSALQNAGATAVPSSDATAPSAANASLVTLALDPRQASDLVNAIASGGQLYAGLRGSDVKVDSALVVSADSLYANR